MSEPVFFSQPKHPTSGTHDHKKEKIIHSFSSLHDDVHYSSSSKSKADNKAANDISSLLSLGSRRKIRITFISSLVQLLTLQSVNLKNCEKNEFQC